MNPFTTPYSGQSPHKKQEHWLNQQMEWLALHSCTQTFSNSCPQSNSNTEQDLNGAGLAIEQCQGHGQFDIGNLAMQSTILKPGNAKINMMAQSSKPGQDRADNDKQVYVAEGGCKQAQVGVPVSGNQLDHDYFQECQSTTSSMIRVTKKNKIKVPGLFSEQSQMENYDMQSNFVQGKVVIDSRARIPRIQEPANGARIVSARGRAKTPRPSPGNRYAAEKKRV